MSKHPFRHLLLLEDGWVAFLRRGKAICGLGVAPEDVPAEVPPSESKSAKSGPRPWRAMMM